MKFFTPEWYHDTLLSELCFQLHVSSRAEKYSDKYFESLYKAQEKWTVKNVKRIAKYSKFEFDKAAAEAEFAENYKKNLEFVTSSLPKDILDSVKDIRLLAIGTVEYAVKEKITRFCGQVARKCEKVSDDYDDELEVLSERLGWVTLNSLNFLIGSPVRRVEKTETDAVIETFGEDIQPSCKVLLKGAGHFEDHGEIVDARVLQHELVRDGENRLSFGLLCMSPDGELVTFRTTCESIEIQEL